jgi:hypothetical protein
VKQTYELVAQLVLSLQAQGCPIDRAMRAEAAILSVVVNTMRPVHDAQQAASLLPFGAQTAAEVLGCHRATVYRRASRRKKPSEVATAGWEATRPCKGEHWHGR